MAVIDLQGEIGWDIWPQNVKDALSSAVGEKELTVRFSSVGGDIFDGADIFNTLMDFKKDNPGIRMNLEIKGVAASMGSMIAAAPVWDSVAVTPITGYMIHNPWNLAIGDYRAMQENLQFLSTMTSAYRTVYMKRTRMSEEEITKLMDETTWYAGQEIVDAGFADKVIDESGAIEPRLNIVMKYENQFKAMQKKQREVKENDRFDSNKAAACMKVFNTKMAVTEYKPGAKLIDEPWDATASETRWREHTDVMSNEDLPKDKYTKRFAWYDAEDSSNFAAYKFPHWDFRNADGEFINMSAVRNGLARVPQSDLSPEDKERVSNLLRRYLDKFNSENGNNTNAKVGDELNIPPSAGQIEQEVPMDKAELKKNAPAVYDDVEKDGVMKERERVKMLTAMKAQDEYKDIPAVIEVIDKAIDEGLDVSAAQPLMMAAMVKTMRDPKMMAQIESPQDISGGDPSGNVVKTHMEA